MVSEATEEIEARAHACERATHGALARMLASMSEAHDDERRNAMRRACWPSERTQYVLSYAQRLACGRVVFVPDMLVSARALANTDTLEPVCGWATTLAVFDAAGVPLGWTHLVGPVVAPRALPRWEP